MTQIRSDWLLPEGYRVISIQTLFEYRASSRRDRPVLDLYLDGSIAIHDVLVPLANGSAPGHVITGRSEELLDTAVHDLQAAAPLAEQLAMNQRTAFNFIGRRGDLFSQLVDTQSMYWGISRPSRTKDVETDEESLRAELDQLLDGLSAIERGASAALSAISYEHELIWRFLREQGRIVDTESAVADLERYLKG